MITVPYSVRHLMPGDVVTETYAEPGSPRAKSGYISRLRKKTTGMTDILEDEFPLTVMQSPIADEFNDWSVLLVIMTSFGKVKRLFVSNNLQLKVIVRKEVIR